MKSITSISVCGLGKLGACMAATFAVGGFPVLVDIDVEKILRVNAGLRLAKQLKCYGYRVSAHGYGAKPSNSRAPHEFDVLVI